MRKLLNLGMSDPLTLGMGHPIADRLETLGRARPTSYRSRLAVLGNGQRRPAQRALHNCGG